MRKGFNPNKDKLLEATDFYHQVVVPVYIPHHKSYFKDALQILDICLSSIFKTVHSKTFITVVNNGSSDKVAALLEEYAKQGKINELVHTINIGKLNAIVKGVSGHNFELVTVTDADVLFLNNWQKATYDIFTSFRKTGFVSPCPSSKVLKKYTANVHLENLFHKRLKFTKVKNPQAQVQFAESIGNSNFYNEHHLDQYLTISKDKTKAVIGGGHFVGTYNGDILRKAKTVFTKYALGGTSENLILDKPVQDYGCWRLSTEDNYAHHMGNTLEDWMPEMLRGLTNELSVQKPELTPVKRSFILNNIKTKLFRYVLLRKPVWNVYLKAKGLDKRAVKDY